MLQTEFNYIWHTLILTILTNWDSTFHNLTKMVYDKNLVYKKHLVRLSFWPDFVI